MEYYKLSKYNIIKTIKNDTWIFNSLTLGFVKIPTNFWNLIIQNYEGSEDVKKESLDMNLIKAGVFVKSDVNELQLYKYFYYSRMFQNAGLLLSIAPTMKCNFCCFYCFEEGNKTAGTMTKEIEENLVKFISKHKRQIIHITWFGGEPLLAFNRIVSICEKLRENDVSFTSNMITNGSLLTETVVKKLPLLCLNHIQISLDGLAPEHDKRRNFKNGAPSFDLIIKNIDRLLEESTIPISIKVTIDHTNSSAYGDVFDYFKRHHPNYLDSGRIRISPNYVRNRNDFDNNDCCFDAEDALAEAKKSFITSSSACGRPNLPKWATPCMFRCKSSFAIDSQGCIYRCLEHLGVPSTKVGDLKTGELSNIKMAQTTFENNPFEEEDCIVCSYLPICGGGCPIDKRKKMQGKKINYCSTYKNNLAELLPYFYEYQYKKTK